MYSANRNDFNAAIKLIKSPSLRSMMGRTKSFRNIEVTPPTISARRNRRRRSKSEFIQFSGQVINCNASSIKQRKSRCYSTKGFRQNKITLFKENTNTQNIRPITHSKLQHILPHSLPKTKEKWLSKYFEDSELFQSPYCFISLKLQELLHLTYNDKHPSTFRIAMAFELLSTFIERSNMSMHDNILMKEILSLVIEGIYPDISDFSKTPGSLYYPLKKPLQITYHTLIRKQPYFKLLESRDEKLMKLQMHAEEISDAVIERMTQFFLKCRKKRSCRSEFIMWKMHTKTRGKLLRYKVQIHNAKVKQIRSQFFYKWKQILQQRKTRAIRSIAMNSDASQNVLGKLAKTRQRSQSVKLKTTSSSVEQKECYVTFEDQLQNKMNGNVATDENIKTFEQQKNDNMSIELMRTNLNYYKKISECRSVFIIEYQKIMETRLSLMLAKEKLMNFLREYETSFDQKHYSLFLMKENEINDAWNYKEQRSPLKQLSIEELVLRWINFHLKRFRKLHPDKVSLDDDFKRVSNFSHDFDDGKIYWWLLRALGLIDDIPRSFDRETVKDLHCIIDELGLNDGLIITEMDILQGNTANNFAFCVNVMCNYTKITLQNEYVSQDVNELDNLFVTIENILKTNTCHQQFSFSESWLRKAMRQSEVMNQIYDQYQQFTDKAMDKIKIINKLHDEFNNLLHDAQSYSLKILSLNRRGIKLFIEDSRGLRDIKDFATINKETFVKFYKLSKSEEEKESQLEAVINKCEKCLKENSHIIKSVFEAYAKRHGDDENLDASELRAFRADMKLGEALTEFNTKSEHGVLKRDFATFLCELCWNSNAKKNPKIFARSFQRFITSLWQRGKTSSEITNVLGLPQVQEILDKYKIALQQIFRAQSMTDSRSKMMFITKKKWTDLLSKYGIIGSDFGTKLAHQAFDVCNSDYGKQGKDSGTKMIYQEFVHGLLAASIIKNSNIFIPLPHRIEGFFDKLCVAATGRKIKF